MKRSIIILFITIGVLLISCKKDDSSTPSYQGSLTNFSVALSETNLLRAEVTATFSSETSFRISYWEANHPSQVQLTNTYQGKGTEHKTLLFLKPETEYACKISYGNGLETEAKHFKTKNVQSFLPNATLQEDKLKEPIKGYLLANDRKSNNIYLMDMNGTVVWYEPVPDTPAVVNYNPRTQQFYLLTDAPSEGLFVFNAKKLKIIDLFGNIVLQKEFASIPELKNREVHHECRPLPDGNIGLVTYIHQTVDLSSKGGLQTDTVTGDGFVIMNTQGEIVKKWSCFDHLNPLDHPNITTKKVKEDWIHANSIDQDSEGNYYMTTNRDSELWKINGKTGELVYRVGENGTIKPTQNLLSHGIHCAVVQAPNEVLVIDNARENKTTGSRALIYKVNEYSKTVSVPLEVALPKGQFSTTRSNVQFIDNQHVLFALSTLKQVIITNRNTTPEIYRTLLLPQTFYRVTYIPTIQY